MSHKPNTFEILRERHHGVARLFAAGHSASEIARLTGTSESQLTRQISDPAFRNLVSRYRACETAPNAAARFQTYAIAA